MKRISIFILMLLVLFTYSIPAYAQADNRGQEQTKDKTAAVYNPDNNGYIVKFKDENKGKEKIKNKKFHVKKSLNRTKAYKLSLSEDEFNELQQDPDIEYIEEDYKVAKSDDIVTPNLSQIHVPAAHQEQATGKGVKVAVLDTGITTASSELNIAGGVSFVEGEPDSTDNNGHGTEVASVLASLKDGQGLLGTAPDVELYAVKVLNSSGSGNYSDVIEGLEWAIDNHMDIVSMSFGGVESSRALQEAVELAVANNIVLIAAAGNGGSGIVDFPARYPDVISVGAVDATGMLASFSNRGKIDLVAPGVNVMSMDSNGKYVNVSGTSIAVPHVAGVAALIKQLNPDYSNAQLEELLLQTTVPLGDPAMFGHGLVDAYNAVMKQSTEQKEDSQHSAEPERSGVPAMPNVTPKKATGDDSQTTKDPEVDVKAVSTPTPDASVLQAIANMNKRSPQAPFAVKDVSENISTQNGSLSISSTDMTLPGRNGLSFSLKRIYNAAAANFYQQDYEAFIFCLCKITFDGIKYKQIMLPDGSIQDPVVIESNTYLMDASTVNDLSMSNLFDATGWYNYLLKMKGQMALYSDWSSKDAYGIRYRIITAINESPNMTFTDSYTGPAVINWRGKAQTPTIEAKRFPIGVGWSWDIPYIKTVEDKRYISLGAGGTYLINGSELDGYKWKDLSVEADQSVTVNGVASSTVLKSVSGVKRYFSEDGRLLQISDNYNNAIKFTYSEDPLYGTVLTGISDPTGQTIQISYSQTQVVLTQGNKTVTYAKSVYNYNNPRPPFDNQPVELLNIVTDEMGRKTYYGYGVKDTRFSVASSSVDTVDPTALLTTITYPTQAWTRYTYETAPVTRYLGSGAVQEQYRISSRKDNNTDGTVWNNADYTYTSPDGLNTDYASAYADIPHFYVNVSNGLTTTTYDNSFDAPSDNTQSPVYYTNAITQKGGDEQQQIRYTYDTVKRNDTPISTTITATKGTAVSTPVTESITYDDYGNILTKTNGLNVTTTYAYDTATHLLSSETNRLSDTQTQYTSYTRNDKGSIIQATTRENNASGKILSQMSFGDLDAYGNVRTMTVLDDGRNNSYSYEYSPALGSAYLTKQSAIVHNADGVAENTTASYNYDPQTGLVNSVIDGKGNTTSYTYDNLGRVIKITNADLSNYTVQYNDSANEVTVKDETGVTSKIKWNPLGYRTEEGIVDGTYRALKKYGYDAYGRLDWEEDANAHRTDYVYDVWSRVSQTILSDGSYSSTQYDPINRRVTSFDPENNAVRVTSDVLGRKVLTEELQGTVYKPVEAIGYDYADHVLSSTDSLGQITKYTYNSAGSLASVTSPNGETTSYSYSLAGALKEIKHPDGKLILKKTDEVGRLIQQTDELGKIEKFYYDSNGNMVKSTDRKGQTFNYVYNNRNQLTSHISPDETVSYTYDKAGRRLTMQDLTGLTTYGHKVTTGELINVTYPDNRIIVYTYNNSGQRSTMTDPFGYKVTYTYDQRNRLKTVGASATDYDASYSYYKNDMLKQISLKNGISSTYTYKNLRLDTLVEKKADGTVLNSFGYQYDSNGNITHQSGQQGQSGQAGAIAFSYAYTYDPLNRIKTSSQNNETYDYDNRGNRITLQSDQPLNIDSQQYEYDSNNRLTKVTTSDGKIVSYKYNGDGLLYERTENNATTRYYYDGTEVIAEGTVTSGLANLKTRYTRGLSLVSVQNSGGTKGYYLHNGHGDVIEIRDSTGNTQLNSYTYDMWGNPVKSAETITNSFRYSGEMWDNTAKLQYLRARWYDPGVGRFINEDTYEGQIDNPLTLNLYTYVRNNPLILHDPTGHNMQVICNCQNQNSSYPANMTPGVGIDTNNEYSFCKWFGCADIALGLSLMGPEFMWLSPAEDAILVGEGAVVKSEAKFLKAPAKKNGVLNIGAGKSPIDGAYNIDINPGANGVYLGDATNLSNIKTGSQGLIIFQNPYKYDVLNAEVSRVLQAGGKVEITGGMSNGTFKKLYNLSESALKEAGYTLVSKGLATDAVQGFTVDGDPVKSTMYVLVLQKI